MKLLELSSYQQYQVVLTVQTSKLGGLGIPIFSEIADREYKFSRMFSKDLTANIINQHRQHASNANATNIKNKIKQIKLQHHQDKLSKLQKNLRDNQRGLLALNQEQEASSWLTTIPIADEGYNLTKQIR